MFDPTAFDNLKTVLEGTIYDEDLYGEMEVVNREDFVNLAVMNRMFKLTFKKKKATNSQATMTLFMTSKELCREILEMSDEPVCQVTVELETETSHLFHIKTTVDKLQAIWKLEADVDVKVSFHPLHEKRHYLTKYTISLYNGLTEDDIEKLSNLYSLTKQSLNVMESS
ncbi:hypothetical protein [Bacillus sp. FJAT-47783]|uniref:hypothetical protein n=1 Tax=Bacillus sp. FJAT-47783 TaxID=2922712 RepID=UPI001FAD5922|nr:hypothetical protein [Bacillus sp. FJAT-47783]